MGAGKYPIGRGVSPSSSSSSSSIDYANSNIDKSCSDEESLSVHSNLEINTVTVTCTKKKMFWHSVVLFLSALPPIYYGSFFLTNGFQTDLDSTPYVCGEPIADVNQDQIRDLRKSIIFMFIANCLCFLQAIRMNINKFINSEIRIFDRRFYQKLPKWERIIWFLTGIIVIIFSILYFFGYPVNESEDKARAIKLCVPYGSTFGLNFGIFITYINLVITIHISVRIIFLAIL